MPNKIEDRIRELIKTGEARLFYIRHERIQYIDIEDEKLVTDPRYLNKVQDIGKEEKALTQKIVMLEAALAQAASIGSQYPGCSRTDPFSWLTDKGKQLKRGIEILETDITMLKRKIEENADVGTRPNVISRSGVLHRAPDATQSWSNQILEKETQVKELRPQLEQVQKLVSEIQKILQSAAPGV